MTGKMTKCPLSSRVESDLRANVAQHFGQPVLRVSLPGGNYRPVYRMSMPDRSIIAVKRGNENARREECALLASLRGTTDLVPRVLGEMNGFTFLEDLGPNRLSVALATALPCNRVRLLINALNGLSVVHDAARRTAAPVAMRPIDSSADDITRLSGAFTDLATLYGLPCPGHDRAALQCWIEVPAPRFVKWDARPANACVMEDGRVSWVDFEHAGQRHGSEDAAFLLLDETVPLTLSDHYDVLRRGLLDHAPANEEPRDYIKRFEIYATLHAAIRLQIIRREIELYGWHDRRKILKYDLVGANPHLALGLAQNAAFMTGLNAETEPFLTLFHAVAAQMRDAIERGNPKT